MQKTILLYGSYPVLEEKLNDLLSRSYELAALTEPFAENAPHAGCVEAAVVYVPYAGEPDDAEAARRYAAAWNAAAWAAEAGMRCILPVDVRVHGFWEPVPEGCTACLLPELYGLDRRGEPMGWLGAAMRAMEAGETLAADDVLKTYHVLADEAAEWIRAALRVGETAAVRIMQTKPSTRFQLLQRLAERYGFARARIEPCDGQLPRHVPRREAEERYAYCSAIGDGAETLFRQQYCAFRLVYLSKPEARFCGHKVSEFRRTLGKALANELPQCAAREADCVIPVPATGICYAEGLAGQLGRPMVNALEKLHRPNNRTLCFADVDRRTEMIRAYLRMTGEPVAGKRVVVVDEAIFTGTTLGIVCRMLREAGAARIHIAIPTPESSCRCARHVLPMMPSLADRMTRSGMAEYFGADSLTFLPGAVFLKEAQKFGAVCWDCFRI